MTLQRGYDHTILVLAVALTCFGLVMVYSSSSVMAAAKYQDGFHFLKRQGLFSLAGFALLAGFMRFDYHRWRKLAVPGLLCSAVALILVLVPGIGAQVNGASRWIQLPGFNFQPAEAVKVAMVIYVANSLAKKQDKVKSFKLGILPYMIVLALLLGLLLLQPDLGSAMTLAIVAGLMLLAAGTRISHLFYIGLLSLPFLYYAVWHVAYRRRRIMAFLDPWQDPTDTGFQIIQSLIAFGTGGLFGNGLGEGKQKLYYLPEAHTDFIFSVVGEELGFAGVLVITSMFLMLVLRGFRTALQAPDDFGRHLAFGITTLLGLEAFINIAVVMGLLPTKGLALPFVSYGGTSLLVTMAAVGILLNVSSQTKEGTP
jgi:cell division protein FtsW